MGCIKLLATLIVIAAIAVLVFLNRDRLAGVFDRARAGSEHAMVAPSPELAEAADNKLALLRTGRSRVVALSEVELQSLLLYKYQGLLPAFIDSPKVSIKADQLTVQARVPIDRLPQLSELGEAAALLPDTTELAVRGKLLPLGKGRVALAVDQVRAARIPLPQRLVPGALRRLGREDEPGLAKDAFAVRLPPGADAAYVRGDSLFFLAQDK